MFILGEGGLVVGQLVLAVWLLRGAHVVGLRVARLLCRLVLRALGVGQWHGGRVGPRVVYADGRADWGGHRSGPHGPAVR